MERNQLHGVILDDLKARATWEQRQSKFYQMRHDGLRRRVKPWPNAADMHFPLSDTIIGKLKPYYFEQLFSTDTLATFVPRPTQDAALTTSAARWFDFKVKQHTNLETEVLTTIDYMLTSGRSVMKVYWDVNKKQVQYDAVSTLNIIVPRHTRDIESADWIVHVMQMSRAAYMGMENYVKDKTFVDSICGGIDADREHDQANLQLDKFEREGITHGSTPDQIIIWETYFKDPTTGKWTITTYSPKQPTRDVRPSMAIPYDHGLPPFVDFVYEIKDKGWFAPRGIPELVAPFEASLSKMWNEKHDCLTLYNRPLFTSSRDLPNQANLQFQPGQILPHDIKPVTHQAPPMSFDQEMVSTRMVAEQRVAIPDFGMGQAIDTRDRKTATEINAIGEMMGNATDLRMRLFRRSLGRVYRMTWELYNQYDKDSLEYFFEENSVKLDQKALHKDYHIMPTGSADGVSRSFMFQKAVTRMQMFNNDPFINQGELRKSVLEADEPALVKRLFTNPQLQIAKQAEDQANELTYLRIGFPATVEPSDDHLVHIRTLVDYLKQRAAVGAQFDQLEHQRIHEHLEAHVAALQESNPKAGNAVRRELQQMFQPPQQQAQQ